MGITPVWRIRSPGPEMPPEIGVLERERSEQEGQPEKGGQERDVKDAKAEGSAARQPGRNEVRWPGALDASEEMVPEDIHRPLVRRQGQTNHRIPTLRPKSRPSVELRISSLPSREVG